MCIERGQKEMVCDFLKIETEGVAMKVYSVKLEKRHARVRQRSAS